MKRINDVFTVIRDTHSESTSLISQW